MSVLGKVFGSIETILDGIPAVVADIESRPDYGNSNRFKDAIKILKTFEITLLANKEISDVPSMNLMRTLRNQAENEVLVQLAGLVHVNVKMMKLGPLNIFQTIPSSMANSHNDRLKKLHYEVQLLTARVVAALSETTPADVSGLQLDEAASHLVEAQPAEYEPASTDEVRGKSVTETCQSDVVIEDAKSNFVDEQIAGQQALEADAIEQSPAAPAIVPGQKAVATG